MISEENNSTKEQLKRARRVALMLAATAIISLSFLVFALVQKMEADKYRQLSEQSLEKAIELEKEAAMARVVAERERERAEQHVAETMRVLEECSKTKK